MALRDQPYLPLYIKDFTTDLELIECSALATGVYIRIMCLLHKTEVYGVLSLQAKDKQNIEQNTEQKEKQIYLFALKLVKYLPYNLEVILQGLSELVKEKVLQIDGDDLIQKRMFKDGIISQKRALTGSLGGKAAQSKNFALPDFKAKVQAKIQANEKANAVYVNANENENNNTNKTDEKPKKDLAIRSLVLELCPQFDDTRFFIAWADFEQVRREKRKPVTHTAAKLSLKKLAGYDLEIAIQSLRVSASNSWTGVFPESVKSGSSSKLSENTDADYSQDPNEI